MEKKEKEVTRKPKASLQSANPEIRNPARQKLKDKKAAAPQLKEKKID